MAAPAAYKASKNQRRQNRQSKKYETRVDRAPLESRHRLRRLDGRNRRARDSPLNEVGDHQQIQSDECSRPPAAGFGLSNLIFLNRGTLENRKLNRPLFL